MNLSSKTETSSLLHSRGGITTRCGRLAGAVALTLSAALAPWPAAASVTDSVPAPVYGGATVMTHRLALWYIVHNPSICKPRGDQSAPDGRTFPGCQG